MIDQHFLRSNHVTNGNDGKRQPIGLAGDRIEILGPRGAKAATQHIGANDEETIGIDRQAGTGQQCPPAGLAGDRVGVVRHILSTGQGMRHQDRVRTVRIQRAIGLIGDRIRPQLDTAIKLHRRIGAQRDNLSASS